MNFDMTFCSGLRCDRKRDCKRWTKNMQAQAKREGISLDGQRINMAQLADHAGNCDDFLPKGDK